MKRPLILALACSLLFACGDDKTDGDAGGAGTAGGASGTSAAGNGGAGGEVADAGPLPDDGVWGCSEENLGLCSCAMVVGARKPDPSMPDPSCKKSYPCCWVQNVKAQSELWQCYCNERDDQTCTDAIGVFNQAGSLYRAAERIDSCPPADQDATNAGAEDAG